MEILPAVTTLSALAQESRLAIFRLLVVAGPEGLAAGEIAARCRLAPATLSFHVAMLKRAGLVRAERRGRHIIYGADYTAMGALMKFLTENCCGGDEGACALPDIAAERGARGGAMTGRDERAR